MALDKNDLISLIAVNINDNIAQEITPAKVREVLEQMVTADLNLEELTLQLAKGDLTLLADLIVNLDLSVGGDVSITGAVSASNILENVVIVKQSNFASVFGSAIDSTKNYFIDGIIDISGLGVNPEIPAGGIFFSGYNFNQSGIKCTDDNFTLFTSPAGGSGDVLFDNFFVEISGANSKVYDIKGDTGNEAIEIEKINFNNCTSRGVIDNYRQGLEGGTGMFGGTPELTLTGAWVGGYFIDTSIVRGLTDGAYSLFKAGAGFLMSSRFRSNQNIDLPASVSFLDFSPANFVNPSTLQLEGCIITRNGVSDASDINLTPNISASDLASDWSQNNGLSNTFVGGELNITSEVTTTITSAGVFVDLAGVYAVDDLQHFDEPANGQLRHLGTSPREFSVGGQLVIDSSSNNEVDIKIVIFRAATVTFEDGKTIRRVINNLQGGRDVAYFVLDDNIILNKDDYIKLQTANVTATNNITAEIDSYVKVSAR